MSMEYIKRFKEWLGLKEAIDMPSDRFVRFAEREVWMCYFGENVGYESCGRHDHFHRPVVVLRKLGAYTFYALPLSTKIKERPYHMVIEFKGKKQSALIGQVRVLDVRRLHYRMGRLSQSDYRAVESAFLGLFGQKITPREEGSA